MEFKVLCKHAQQPREQNSYRHLTLTYFSTIVKKITSHYMTAEISTNIVEFNMLKTSTGNQAAKSGTCSLFIEDEYY